MIKRPKNIVPKKVLRQPLTKEEVEKLVYTLKPIGFVKGKIGPWRVRWQNGKPIIYKKADIYNASQTAASINNRNNMGAAFRLAAALNKGPLKEIWTHANAPGRNSYTRLIKHFRKTLKGNLPSINNSITPEVHHFKKDNFITFDSEKIIKINKALSADESLVIVLMPFMPVKSGLKEFELIHFCVSGAAGSEIELNNEQIKLCGNYSRYILHSVLIRNSGENVIWSDTTAAEGEFCVCDEKEIYIIHLFPISEIHEIRSRKSEVRRTKKKAHAPPGIAAA